MVKGEGDKGGEYTMFVVCMKWTVSSPCIFLIYRVYGPRFELPRSVPVAPCSRHAHLCSYLSRSWGNKDGRCWWATCPAPQVRFRILSEMDEVGAALHARRR